jgi:uncharacterized membrane protein YoaK (UPF0700 family)
VADVRVVSAGAPAAPPAALPVVLSVVAGLTDVTTFVLGGVFSAHITGNVVLLGADLASGRAPAWGAALAVPCFVLAAVLVTVLVAWRPAAGRWPHRLLAAQALLVVGAGAVAVTSRAAERPGSAAALVTELLAVAAMATQNAMLHVCWRHSATTSVVTGNTVATTVSLTRVVLARGADPESRALLAVHAPPLLGFVGGVVLGAATARAFSDWGWAAPAVVSLACWALSPRLAPAPDRVDRRRPGSGSA